MGCSCLTTPVLGRVKASPLQHQLFSSLQGSSFLGRLLAHARISTFEAVNQTHPLLLSAQQHPHPVQGRGSVRRLPVHAEAVDASVFGVAPIAQHPELHQLVCAHGVTLGEKGKEKLETLRALSGSETSEAPFSSQRSGAPGANHLPPNKMFGWGRHRGCR